MPHIDPAITNWIPVVLSGLLVIWAYIRSASPRAAPPVDPPAAPRCNSVNSGSRCELSPDHDCPHGTALGKVYERWWRIEPPGKDPAA